jgi:hypothetical protein
MDIIRIDSFDREWHSGVRVERNILPDPMDVISDQRIIDKFRCSVDFIGELAPEGDLLVKCIEIDMVSIEKPMAGKVRVLFIAQRFLVGLTHCRRNNQYQRYHMQDRSIQKSDIHRSPFVTRSATL